MWQGVLASVLYKPGYQSKIWRFSLNIALMIVCYFCKPARIGAAQQDHIYKYIYDEIHKYIKIHWSCITIIWGAEISQQTKSVVCGGNHQVVLITYYGYLMNFLYTEFLEVNIHSCLYMWTRWTVQYYINCEQMLQYFYTQNTNEKHSPESLFLLAGTSFFVPSDKQTLQN